MFYNISVITAFDVTLKMSCLRYYYTTDDDLQTHEMD